MSEALNLGHTVGQRRKVPVPRRNRLSATCCWPGNCLRTASVTSKADFQKRRCDKQYSLSKRTMAFLLIAKENTNNFTLHATR